jgi:hypothetical protein
MAKHGDEAEDKKLVKHMVKHSALKMKGGGGVSNENRKKYGRNLARAHNQKGGR